VDPRTTRYDLASLTKVVGTTSAVMLLESRGAVELDAPVVRYLPDWDRGDPRKARVTLRDLLLHRGGLPPFRRWFLELDGKEAFVRAIEDEALATEPGATTAYSDVGFMTLGLVVEAVSGRTLDRFLEEELFSPLGMSSTGFLPDASLLPRIAPTEEDSWRGAMVRGIVHDENAWAMGGVAGHAGLFSTAGDLARFTSALAAAVRAGGQVACALPPGSPEGGGDCPPPLESAGAPLPASASAWVRRWSPGSTRALGWDTPSPNGSSAGDYLSAAAFGHTGFTGTSIWIDPELDLWVVLLTNRVHPTRENQKHIPLRRAVHDAVARAVTDRAVPRRGGSGG
jgi:CubicO group peptidase (beta-lactamase class C family)